MKFYGIKTKRRKAKKNKKGRVTKAGFEGGSIRDLQNKFCYRQVMKQLS